MASDPIVPHPVVGPSVEADVDFDSLVLGPEIRGNKYCKIYAVVASSWQTEPAEAHVFESTSKAQARFLNRSVWPKLRKSLGFKQEVKKDDGRTIFIISDRGSTLAKEAETPNLKPNQPDLATTAKAIPHFEPAASAPSTVRDLPINFKPSAVGKAIFLRYHVDGHGGDSTPVFQSEGFPNAAQQPTAVGTAHLKVLESMKWFESERLPPRSKTIPIKHSSAIDAILKRWKGQSDDGRKRRGVRQTPEARNIQFILSLAAEIAEESLDCDPDGECQFGYGFMIEHLYPWQKQLLASQALDEQTNRHRLWSDHLGRLLQHLHGILKTQEAKVDRAWLESLHELHYIFGDKMPSGEQTEHQAAQNVVVMRWIIERSFSGFGSEAVATLAASFDCDVCDGEPIMRWMLRIRSHVRMRKWASEELSKAPDSSDRANPVLMRLIEAHIAHELVLGMKPILDRMYLISQKEFRYWEGKTAFLRGDDIKQLEKIHNRWRTRRSVLKPKKTE